VSHNVCMTAKRAYGGVSADERRSQRRATLIEAALDVIGTQGFAAMTISGLCKQTGLNDRYFSESFDSREAVFSAVIDQLVTELAVSMNAAIAAAGAELATVARAAIAATVEYLTDDPRRARITFTEAPTTPVVAQRRREVLDYFLRMAEDHVSELLGEGAPSSSEAVRFAGVALFGVLMETTTTWLADGLPMSRDELIDNQTALALALLESAPSVATQG
jgi:AcrR family transcriptional regulator